MTEFPADKTKVVIVCASVEATSTSKTGNSNKFHQWERQSDGGWKHTYGRVGAAGVSAIVPESKARAKFREAMGKGYVLVDVANTDGVEVKAGNENLKEAAEEQIAKGDPKIKALVHYLAERNVHNITSSTTMKYNAVTGLFSTPLGVVTRDTIAKARALLAQAQALIEAKKEDDKVATQYLMLIPQDIGRDRPTFERVFPDLDAIQKQSDILDSLSASLDMVDQAKSSSQPVVEKQKVFDLTLALIEDKKEIERIRKFYKDTLNRTHAAAVLDVDEVYTVHITQMKANFEKDGKTVGGIRELWHGTSVGNVLSILQKGLIIPTSASNGRMFGNGIYFSDISTKSLNYAYGYWGGNARDNQCFMFLAEVAMGKPYTPPGPCSSIPKGYDSCFAAAGKSSVQNNEMIVYRLGQANITHLVRFAPPKRR